jgi:hypothetical protein
MLIVYCILGGGRSPRLPRGVAGRKVSLVRRGSLAAAVSAADDSFMTPGVHYATAFANVIDSLHHGRAVLPLRYGCFVRDVHEVQQLLEDQGPRFAAALAELAGCDEMSVLLMMPQAGPQERRELPRQRSAGALKKAPRKEALRKDGSGAAYLAARRRMYEDRQQQSAQMAKVTRELRLAFRGLFKKIKAEAAGQAGMISVHFLVPRASRAAFNKAFAELQSWIDSPILLSGPWPPYNFADLPATDSAKRAG